MRNSFLFILSCMAFGWMTNGSPIWAQKPTIKAIGNVITIEDTVGIDYVFIFDDLTSASVSSDVSYPYWQKIIDGNSTSCAEGSDDVQLEHNMGYILTNPDGDEEARAMCWVLDYSQCKTAIHGIEINDEYDNTCEETELLLDAIIPEMSYQDKYGNKHTIKRKCQVKYQSLSWQGEEWGDSLCVETTDLRNIIHVGAPLQNTIFTVYDNQFAPELGLPIDSITTHEYEARAIAVHPTTITSTRGETIENEEERPIDEKQTSGSAPLDIFFQANATPAAKYYQWHLLKGNDLIAQRTDADQRYTFDEYGEYRALLWVSNDYCKTDSVEIKISVKASKLLVPNVFTPNGDGVNDEFRVMYKSITSFHCWVYNRWGHKVFEWSDPAKGWDGTINGRDAAESAYFYVIRATGADGVQYELKGDINLIRGKKK